VKAKMESLPGLEGSHSGIVVSSENEEEAERLQNLMNTGASACVLTRDKGTVEITIAPPCDPNEEK